MQGCAGGDWALRVEGKAANASLGDKPQRISLLFYVADARVRPVSGHHSQGWHGSFKTFLEASMLLCNIICFTFCSRLLLAVLPIYMSHHSKRLEAFHLGNTLLQCALGIRGMTFHAIVMVMNSTQHFHVLGRLGRQPWSCFQMGKQLQKDPTRFCQEQVRLLGAGRCTCMRPPPGVGRL